jgi:hypothetical protein
MEEIGIFRNKIILNQKEFIDGMFSSPQAQQHPPNHGFQNGT